MSIALNYLSLRGWFGSYDNAVFGAILILIISLAPEGPLKPLGLGSGACAGAAARHGPSLTRPLPGRGRSRQSLANRTVGFAETVRCLSQGEGRGEGEQGLHIRRQRKEADMALLEVAGVRRSFGGLVAVDGVSLTVTAGQIKGVIGPNGAGKTTLFNMISGLLKPDTGQISFKDRPIAGLKPYQVASAGISRTFQNPSLFLQMNVSQNVMVGRHNRTRWDFFGCGLRWPGQPREERAIREAARAQLDYVGLAHLADLPAGALPFGQRRMVELARALATEPEMLLLDEPASGLNTREKEDLGVLIRKIRDRGITVLLVEHDMSVVMGLSDDVLVLHNGCAIAEGAPAVVQNDQKVISVYLGGEFQHVTPG